VAHLHETQVAAQAIGVALLILEPHSPDEFARVFAAMSQAGAGALLVLSAPFLLQWQLPSITALAQQHRLPAIYPHRMYMDAVGLMYYGTSLREACRHTAYYDVGGSIDPIAACGGQAALADLLQAGTTSITDLAAATGIAVPVLSRVMHALTRWGERRKPAPPTNVPSVSRGRSRSGGFSSDGWASCRAERAPAA
jgi:hypothetical protein